jgi:hypothetical protein
VKCSIKWKSITRPLYGITSATRLVKGRFVYVCCYSPDGQMLAIVLNQKLAKNTRLLFCSTLHSTSCIVDMKCCGGSDLSSGRCVTWPPVDPQGRNEKSSLVLTERHAAVPCGGTAWVADCHPGGTSLPRPPFRCSTAGWPSVMQATSKGHRLDLPQVDSYYLAVRLSSNFAG